MFFPLRARSPANLMTHCILIAALIGCAAEEPVAIGSGESSRWRIDTLAMPTGDSVEVSRPLIVRSGPNGLIYFGSQLLTQLPMILDSNAKFRQTIGHIGEGPGELRYVAFLIPKADSIIVGGLGGASSLYDESGKYVRDVSVRLLSHVGQVLMLRGDTVLFAEPIMSDDRFGLPFHVVAPSGELLRSFGADDRSVDPNLLSAQSRFITRATDSTFWAGRVDRYVVELWHIDGSLQRRFILERDWYPLQEADWDGLPGSRPPSRVKGLHQTSGGELLVILERGRADWRPGGGAETDRSREPEGTSSLLDRMDTNEHIIEVLDAETGSLVDSIVGLNTYLIDFLDDGRIVGLRRGPRDQEFPIVLRLVQPESSK